jgi:hypothetical protein
VSSDGYYEWGSWGLNQCRGRQHARVCHLLRMFMGSVRMLDLNILLAS